MNKKKKNFIEDKYKEKKIELDKFKLLSTNEQYKEIEDILNYMYENKVKVNKGIINKCLKLLVTKHDDYMILSHHLIVEKDSKIMAFKFEKRSSKFPIIIIFLFALLVALMAATYSGLLLLKYSHLNKDIDGDKIADLNIDINKDKVPDINIDNNKNDKPDINIDYKGNHKAIFNLDKDNDGKADFNLVINASKNPEDCKVNCDINNDGWPDRNYDIDGDGKADFDIYSKELDAIKDSIDLNGDMICDVMCDDDNDGECDRNCIVTDDEILGSGPSGNIGNGDNNVGSGSLMVEYKSNGEFFVEDLMPDDQPGYEEKDYPSNTFVVTNNSKYTLVYKVTMTVENNTYTSDNFQYKIDSTNGGYESEFKTAPKEDTLLSSYILIKPKSKQEYTITFRLRGTGEEQNYDQGKKFEGHIKIGE